MGSYVIPGHNDSAATSAAIAVAREAGVWHEGMEWDWGHPEGILVTDPTRTDQELEVLYAGFTFDPLARPLLPQAFRTHAGHLRDYRDAVRAGALPTAAQTQHVIADIIDWLRLTEDRL